MDPLTAYRHGLNQNLMPFVYAEDDGAGSGGGGNGGDGGAAEPEYVTDPKGNRVRVADIWEMRAESTRRLQAASESEERSRRLTEQLLGSIGRNNDNEGATVEGTKHAEPAFDLSKIEALDEDGLSQLGEALNLGVNATKEDVLNEVSRRNEDLKKELTGEMDQRELQRAVTAENMQTLDDYFEEMQVPRDKRAALKREFVAHLRGLPKLGRYGEAGEDGYWRFNRGAMQAVDRTLRGDEIVKRAEAQAAEKARRELLEAGEGHFPSSGGGSIGKSDFEGLDLNGKFEFLDGLGDDDAKFDWLEDNFSEEEALALLHQGARDQIKRQTGGYRRGRAA